MFFCCIKNILFNKECSYKNEETCNYKKGEKCHIFNSYSELAPDKKTELTVEFFKLTWGKWTMKIAMGGLAIIFLVSIIKSIFDPSIDIEELKLFNALQIWVSFILGIIASLFSIISMYLSFYNLEQQQQAEKRTADSFNELKEKIVSSINQELKKEIKNVHDSLENHLKQIEDKFPQEYKNKVDTTKMDIIKFDEDIYGDDYEKVKD